MRRVQGTMSVVEGYSNLVMNQLGRKLLPGFDRALYGLIQDLDEKKTKALYEKLLHVAKRKTAEADTKLDERGKKVQSPDEEFGENVLIVEPVTQ